MPASRHPADRNSNNSSLRLTREQAEVDAAVYDGRAERRAIAGRLQLECIFDLQLVSRSRAAVYVLPCAIFRVGVQDIPTDQSR